MKLAPALVLIGAALAACGMAVAHTHEEGESVRVISSEDIKEKLDGQDATATIVEVTLEPGQPGVAHRHPGPGFVAGTNYGLCATGGSSASVEVMPEYQPTLHWLTSRQCRPEPEIRNRRIRLAGSAGKDNHEDRSHRRQRADREETRSQSA